MSPPSPQAGGAERLPWRRNARRVSIMSTPSAVAPPAVAVRIEGLRVDFEREGEPVRALDGLDLSVREREFLAIVGPSGCGKSTLLNVLAGTLRPSAGAAWVDGAPVVGINRSLGYVTQEDNLLPWRTLLGNIELPLELRGRPAAERRERAMELIRRVELERFENHF